MKNGTIQMKFGTIAMKFGTICFIQQMAQNQYNLAHFRTVDFYRRQQNVKSTLSMVTTLLFSSKVSTTMTQTLPRDSTLLQRPNSALESARLDQISSPALKPFTNTQQVRPQKHFFYFPLALGNIQSSGVSLKILQNAIQMH